MTAPSFLPFFGFLLHPAVIVVWSIIWLIAIYLILTRKDFDPVTKLLWVVVVIFVPFFGVVFYWVAAPSSSAPVSGMRLGSDVAGTPWEKNPGHRD